MTAWIVAGISTGLASLIALDHWRHRDLKQARLMRRGRGTGREQRSHWADGGTGASGGGDSDDCGADSGGGCD